MSGSFLPSLGRQQPQFTRVEGADIVMKSCEVLLYNSGKATNQELTASLGTLEATAPTRNFAKVVGDSRYKRKAYPRGPYETPRSICIPISFGFCSRRRVLDPVGTRTDTQTGLDDDAAGYRQLHAGQGESTPIASRLDERALSERDSDRPVHAEKRLGVTSRQGGFHSGAVEHRDS